MPISRSLALVTAACALGACTGPPTPPAPPPPPPDKTVFAPMLQQLDKARAVQATVDANAAATRAAVDGEDAPAK